MKQRIELEKHNVSIISVNLAANYSGRKGIRDLSFKQISFACSTLSSMVMAVSFCDGYYYDERFHEADAPKLHPNQAERPES